MMLRRDFLKSVGMAIAVAAGVNPETPVEVAAVAQLPEGMPFAYVIDLGTWEQYPLISGRQMLKFLGSNKWVGPTVKLSDFRGKGDYRWELTFVEGQSSVIELMHMSGKNILDV